MSVISFLFAQKELLLGNYVGENIDRDKQRSAVNSRVKSSIVKNTIEVVAPSAKLACRLCAFRGPLKRICRS